jgi:hypothetical protein
VETRGPGAQLRSDWLTRLRRPASHSGISKLRHVFRNTSVCLAFSHATLFPVKQLGCHWIEFGEDKYPNQEPNSDLLARNLSRFIAELYQLTAARCNKANTAVTNQKNQLCISASCLRSFSHSATKCSHFVDPGVPLPCLQEFVTGHYLQPDEASPYCIHYSLFYRPRLGLTSSFIPSDVNKNVVSISIPPSCALQSHPPRFHHPYVIW